MGDCASAPSNNTDIEYERVQNASCSSIEHMQLPKNWMDYVANKDSRDIGTKKGRRKHIRINKIDTSCSNQNVPIIECLDYNIPNLPIQFTKDREIWIKEYNLFTEYVSNVAYPANMDQDTDRNVVIEIIERCLEYSGIDRMYKSGICGLWPQHYIHNISTNNLNENCMMIVSNISDKLINSFNLQSIFEICGNCFSRNPSMVNIKKFFVYGVGIDIDIDSSYSSYHDGYTSATSYIGNYGVNPLKFKVDSHDIMVCNKGCYIKRHNEHCQQDDGEQSHDTKETQYDQQEDDPSYLFTMLLLPPNISTYQGGSYRFYDVEDNGKYQLNMSRVCTPASTKQELSSSSSSILETDDNREEKKKFETECVEVRADCNEWSWIIFDKRVEYECGPIINGYAVTFKMDIDVQRETIKEIKQYEGNDDNNIDSLNHDRITSMSFDSLTSSANIVFTPYPVTLKDINL